MNSSEAIKEILSKRDHFFITGKAGTGKSTLLRKFLGKTKDNAVVVAPTGVAALNVGGETIHSFFRLRPGGTFSDIYKMAEKARRIYNEMDTLIIDEISMVRADLLDMVDYFLRIQREAPDLPFGGVRVIFFGDLYQLPPVLTNNEKSAFSTHYKSPYFFEAKVMKQISIRTLELTKVYRQSDEDFINTLNNIRHGQVTDGDLELINSQVDPEYTPDEDDKIIYLTTTNAIVEKINRVKLSRIDSDERIFKSTVSGQFNASAAPVDELLTLKRGAQVMMVNNDSQNRWVNGSLGKIREFYEKDGDRSISVELEGGEIVEVEPNSWESHKYGIDDSTGKVVSNVIGSFTQFPLKLAWAITIHKSQGKTFDRVYLDLGYGSFAHGQTYVALSRVRSLEGLVLRRACERKDLIVDPEVVDWINGS